MADEKRDPRLNPKSGDELVIFYGGRVRWLRRVISAPAVGEFKGGVRYATNSGHRTPWMPLYRWQEQMKHAEVIHQAE